MLFDLDINDIVVLQEALYMLMDNVTTDSEEAEIASKLLEEFERTN